MQQDLDDLAGRNPGSKPASSQQGQQKDKALITNLILSTMVLREMIEEA
jgi:hypothetical protein